MEQLQVRILIKHVNENRIAYLYNREAFELLKITKDTDDNSQFVSIGDIIEYDGKSI